MSVAREASWLLAAHLESLSRLARARRCLLTVEARSSLPSSTPPFLLPNLCQLVHKTNQTARARARASLRVRALFMV